MSQDEMPDEPKDRAAPTDWSLLSGRATPSADALRAARARLSIDDPDAAPRARGRFRRAQLALVAAEIRGLAGHHRRVVRE